MRQYPRSDGFYGTTIFGSTTTSNWSSTIPCSFPTRNNTISSLITENSAWKTHKKPKNDHQSPRPQTRLSIPNDLNAVQHLQAVNNAPRESDSVTTMQEQSKTLKRKASDCGENLDLELSLSLTSRNNVMDHKKKERSAFGEDEVDSSLSLSLSSNPSSKPNRRLKEQAADSRYKEMNGKRTSTLDLTI